MNMPEPTLTNDALDLLDEIRDILLYADDDERDEILNHLRDILAENE